MLEETTWTQRRLRCGWNGGTSELNNKPLDVNVFFSLRSLLNEFNVFLVWKQNTFFVFWLNLSSVELWPTHKTKCFAAVDSSGPAFALSEWEWVTERIRLSLIHCLHIPGRSISNSTEGGCYNVEVILKGLHWSGFVTCTQWSPGSGLSLRLERLSGVGGAMSVCVCILRVRPSHCTAGRITAIRFVWVEWGTEADVCRLTGFFHPTGCYADGKYD